MSIKTLTGLFLGAGFALGVSAAGTAVAQEWTPEKPINIIVPWSAGGSTDQVTRIVAAELEKALGGTVVVQNQPGASGSIGSKSALDSDPDGYTWTAGAAQDLGTYKVLGMLDTSIEDWNLYLDVANVAVIGVNADSPYQTMDDMLQAMKDDPQSVTVATAGLNSGGHNAIEAIKKAAGGDYKHVTYDGGNPAVIATVSGETMATTQLAVEQAEMIRAKRIRPLAVLNAEPLILEGYGEIPPITDFVKDVPIAPNYFGIFVPKTAPAEVVAALDKVWAGDIANSQALKDYAANRGAVFAPFYGDDAQKRVLPAIQNNAYLLFDGGKAKVDPASVGITRPE
uniref:Bug family tripartite tricarboxylate transporter substrate binding protein n=1 Tax=Pararhizobium sp. IMCC3301 TaxID=3067904 RepID=UPI0027412DC9|nr:tripartite tricarboxylate transporter substrate binding protein [Pararhizobium sp. IMCC3301]